MKRASPRDRGRQPRKARPSASRLAAAAACPGSASITPLAIRERYSSRRVIGAPASAAAPVGQGSLGLGARTPFARGDQERLDWPWPAGTRPRTARRHWRGAASHVAVQNHNYFIVLTWFLAITLP